MIQYVIAFGLAAFLFWLLFCLSKEPDIPAEICFVICALATVISWVGLYTHSLRDNGITAGIAIVAPIIALACFGFKDGSGIGWFDWSRPDPPPPPPAPVKAPLPVHTASDDIYDKGRWATGQDLQDAWGGRNKNQSPSDMTFKD